MLGATPTKPLAVQHLLLSGAPSASASPRKACTPGRKVAVVEASPQRARRAPVAQMAELPEAEPEFETVSAVQVR
jgi:hypothetical protein